MRMWTASISHLPILNSTTDCRVRLSRLNLDPQVFLPTLLSGRNNVFPSVSNRAKRELGLVLVIGSGITATAVHLIHAGSSQEDHFTFLVGILVPLVFAILLTVGGVWLSRAQVRAGYVLSIGLWTVFMASVVTVGQFLTIMYQQAEGVQMSHVFFVLANAATAGGVVGFVIGLYDTRQQRARHRAERLQDQLTVLNRVLRHDIRNGATVIQGHAELIADELARNGHADRIKRQADDLVKLGDHARTIEKLQQEQGTPREPVDVTGTLETQIATLEDSDPGVEIDATLTFDGSASTHPLIGVALENVLENAVEHTNDPEPSVSVSCIPVQSRRSERVEIRIADTGPGIPPDEVAVLERGYETPLDHTSGLGLWLVNWIVTQSGGRVWFEENEPTGSVVCIRLETAEPDPLPDPLSIPN